MIWDGVQYLYPNKRKTTAFSKFSVIFWQEKSTFTFTQRITTVSFLFFLKIDEITWSFVVYNFIHDDCLVFFPGSFQVIPSQIFSNVNRPYILILSGYKSGRSIWELQESRRQSFIQITPYYITVIKEGFNNRVMYC